VVGSAVLVERRKEGRRTHRKATRLDKLGGQGEVVILAWRLNVPGREGRMYRL